jgi:hypothetical protein
LTFKEDFLNTGYTVKILGIAKKLLGIDAGGLAGGVQSEHCGEH